MTQEELHSQLILIAPTWDHTIHQVVNYFQGKSRLEWQVALRESKHHKFQIYISDDLTKLFPLLLKQITDSSIEQTLCQPSQNTIPQTTYA